MLLARSTGHRPAGSRGPPLLTVPVDGPPWPVGHTTGARALHTGHAGMLVATRRQLFASHTHPPSVGLFLPLPAIGAHPHSALGRSVLLPSPPPAPHRAEAIPLHAVPPRCHRGGCGAASHRRPPACGGRAAHGAPPSRHPAAKSCAAWSVKPSRRKLCFRRCA